MLYGVLVLLVAVLFLKSPGTSDVRLFMQWIDDVRRFGVFEGYKAANSVQPPVYALIFWAMAKAGDALQVSDFIAYKSSLLFAWLLTGVCLWQWTHRSGVVWTILLALIPNSMGLGYFDIYLAPLLLSALRAAQTEHWAIFSASFAIFALTKGQALIIAPFAAVFALSVALRERTRRRVAWVLAQMLVPAAAISVFVWILFGAAMNAALRRALENHVLSGNALNLPWIVSHYIHRARPRMFGDLFLDGSAEGIRMLPTDPVWIWTRASFFVGYCLILITYIFKGRSFVDFVLYSLLGFLAYFVLNTGVHENHLVYAVMLSVPLFLIDERYVYHAAICCLASNINMIMFYGLTGEGLPFSRVVGIDLAVIFAAANVAFFAIAIVPIFARRGLHSASSSAAW